MPFDGRTLVVGGAGYIGSHVLLAARDGGASTVALDDLSTGHQGALPSGQPFVQGDLGDEAVVARACSEGVSAAMHFASFIQVGESVRDPGKYYANNVAGTIRLLSALCKAGVRYFIFSSSAAVYGEPNSARITEAHPTAPVNPYGRTKLMIEHMLPDYERAYGLKWVALRYFNAAGADPEGRAGEMHEPETHLIPLALRAAAGKLQRLTVFGNDYPTADGTCVRDYVHVSDLAQAHWLALDHLAAGGASGTFNLGNGDGFSVRQVLAAVGRVTGHTVPAENGARREGDPAVLVADATKARSVLGWSPRHAALEAIVDHAWNWERKSGCAKIRG